MLKKHRRKGVFGKQGSAFSSKKFQKKEFLDILFLTPGNNYSGDWVSAWTNLVMRLSTTKIKFGFINRYSSNIYYSRMMCLDGDNQSDVHQELFNGQVDYKYIVWLDSDNIPTYDGLQRLILQNKDIVAGIYHMENGEYATVESISDMDFYVKNKSRFKFIDNDYIKNFMKDKTKKTHMKEFLLPVAFTGMGFMVVKKGVFEAVGYPWFMPQRFEVPCGKGVMDFMGDDISFCKLAKEKGYQTYVDLGVKVGHEKKFTI